MVEETEIKKSITKKKIVLLDKILKFPIDEWTYDEQLRPPTYRQHKGYWIKKSDIIIWLICRESEWRPFLYIMDMNFYIQQMF